MRNTPYYSTRTGKNPEAKPDLPMLLRLFRKVYLEKFWQKDYFVEAFGYNSGVGGKLGSDIEAFMFRRLRKQNLWPIEKECNNYSEDDLFDVIEFLYDYVSKPVDGKSFTASNALERSVGMVVGESYLDCRRFDQKIGRQEFRDEINELLRDYKDGYALSEEGEISAISESGMELLLQEQLPEYNPENVEKQVEAAIHKFRNRHSSPDDKRDAVRGLADVLEFLRPKLKDVLTNQDENDLFNIANNFHIRHHNDNQKANYDKSIWHNWMFYYYLATIHASIRLIKKQEDKGS